jgi:hypothetical protein
MLFQPQLYFFGLNAIFVTFKVLKVLSIEVDQTKSGFIRLVNGEARIF